MIPRSRQAINHTLGYFLLLSYLLFALATVSAQELPEAVTIEARFSLLGEVKDDYLSAKINVFTLPDETQFKSLGLFWKAADQAEGDVFFSGQGLKLEGYQLAYADGQVAQMHMTLEPTATRPLLHGAVLGGTGRLNLDDYPEPQLSNNTAIHFEVRWIENDPELRGTLIFSLTDEQGEVFLGAGLVHASEASNTLLGTGTIKNFEVQEGPSSSTRYATFELNLSESNRLSVPLALIMPEQAFKSIGE